MSDNLHVRLLGEFYLAADGVPIQGANSERLQALLAFMLLHQDAPQFRQQIAVYLWPDATDADAKANLRRRLHELKQAIPGIDRWLRIDAKTIQWVTTEDFQCDVVTFNRAIAQADTASPIVQTEVLKQAAALYRGDLLPSCYDDWIVPYREQLRQQAIAALDTLITLLTSQDNARSAVGYAQQLQRLDPLYEPAYAHLMRLHAQMGDRASALRIYYQCMTTLQAELGVSPSSDISKLYEQLLLLDEAPGNTLGDSLNPIAIAPCTVPQAGKPEGSESAVDRMNYLASTAACLVEVGRDMARAEALLLEAQSIRDRMGVSSIEIPFGLGCVRRFQGHTDQAKDLLRQGWHLAQIAQHHWYEFASLINLVMLELETGNPLAARLYCTELLHAAAQTKEESETAHAAALNAVAQYLLQEKQAAENLDQACQELQRIDSLRMLAYVQTIAAQWDLTQEDWTQALDRAEMALALAQRVKHPSAIALAWAVIIESSHQMGHIEQSQQRFVKLQQQLQDYALSALAQQRLSEVEALLQPSSKVTILVRTFSPNLPQSLTHDDWMQHNQSLYDCLSARGVRWLYSYVSMQTNRTVCLFQTPDPEIVTAACHDLQMPFQQVWQTELWQDLDPATFALGHPLIVVECDFDPPLTLQKYEAGREYKEGCYREFDVQHLVSMPNPDCTRFVCVFAATTAEDVRSLYRKINQPVDQLWKATVVQG
ncbi:nickel-binding protein [Nodosilinea nodulosa]|uniref:nickel-binding protein n=1 Tax=Nodosilinea nodulosa TaxID=416001 RepID=UPI0002F02152|nr:nickel-binding protein [Nodosilinea nodulosa]